MCVTPSRILICLGLDLNPVVLFAAALKGFGPLVFHTSLNGLNSNLHADSLVKTPHHRVNFSPLLSPHFPTVYPSCSSSPLLRLSMSGLPSVCRSLWSSPALSATPPQAMQRQTWRWRARCWRPIWREVLVDLADTSPPVTTGSPRRGSTLSQSPRLNGWSPTGMAGNDVMVGFHSRSI